MSISSGGNMYINSKHIEAVQKKKEPFHTKKPFTRCTRFARILFAFLG